MGANGPRSSTLRTENLRSEPCSVTNPKAPTSTEDLRTKILRTINHISTNVEKQKQQQYLYAQAKCERMMQT